MSQATYEATPFRTGKSFCPDCNSSETEILRPKDGLAEGPSFFLCKCGFIGQVGAGPVRRGAVAKKE